MTIKASQRENTGCSTLELNNKQCPVSESFLSEFKLRNSNVQYKEDSLNRLIKGCRADVTD